MVVVRAGVRSSAERVLVVNVSVVSLDPHVPDVAWRYQVE